MGSFRCVSYLNPACSSGSSSSNFCRSLFRRIISNILLAWLRRAIGRGTADMLCCIQNVIEKTLQMSERTIIVFIDYSKAFDSVSHIQMFDILNDMGFPRHIVALIQALYEKQSAIVRWNGAHTKPFFIEKGVRQGCILSPLLFCAYTEQTMREAEITESGAVIGGRSMSNLRYVKTCILGMMSGKRRRGRPRMQYIDNIKKWTRASLEENVRRTEDRTAWRVRSCAAGAANVRTDDAD